MPCLHHCITCVCASTVPEHCTADDAAYEMDTAGQDVVAHAPLCAFVLSNEAGHPHPLCEALEKFEYPLYVHSTGIDRLKFLAAEILPYTS